MALLFAAFLLRLAALAWSFLLALRYRDRRLWLFSGFVAFSSVLTVADVLRARALGVTVHPLEALDDGVASVLICLGVLLVGRLVQHWDRSAREARSSEERYRRLFEQCADAVLLHSGGKFVLANQAAANLLGARTPAELLGLPIIDRVHPDFREQVRSRIGRLQSAASRSVAPMEEVLLKLDGTPIHAEISASVCEHRGAQAIQVVARDISERKRAERDLIESRAVLEKAQAVAHVGSWVWTPGGAPELAWSAETFRIFAVGAEEFDGSMDVFRRRVHADDLERVDAAARSAIGLERPYSIDHRIVRPGGEVRWVHQEAEIVRGSDGVVRLFGAVQDITDQKLAQRALEDSEQRYRQLFNLNPEPTWVCDTQTLRVLAVNEAAVGHYGYSRDEFLRMTVDELSVGEPAGSGGALPRSADHGVRPARHRRKDGGIIEVELTAQAVPFVGPDARLIVARDVTQRLRAEEALREANDRLRAIIWSSPLPIIAVDGAGLVRLWNNSAERIFGWSEAEVLGKPNPIVPHDKAAEFQALVGRIMGGDSVYALELKRTRRDGEAIDVSLSAAPLHGSGREPVGVMAVLADITASRQAERALRESEERLEFAQQCAEAGTWDMDIVSGVGRWSDAFCRLFGSEPIEGPTHFAIWRDRMVPEDLARIQSEMDAIYAVQGPAFRVEFRAVHPTRGQRWFTSMGRIIYGDGGRVQRMAGITMDITDRRRAEDAAAEWANRYEAAVRASRQLLYDWNPGDNRLVWRGNAEEILGIGLEELGDLEHWLDLVHPDDRGLLRSGIDRLIATRAPFTLEHRVRRRDGQYIEVQDTGCYYPDPAGAGGRMIGFVSDITQRKRLESDLRQTQKLDAIGRLASGVSHDFNNLLTAIFGYTSLARRTLSPSHPATRALDRVDDAARQASGVTKALLTFSRESPTEKRPLNLGRTVEESVRLLRRTLPATITLHADLEQTPQLWVRGDPTQLQQIVINLAINARDAMPAGGTLRIRLRRVGEGDAQRAQLSVSDTGTGIPHDVLPRIFEPFFTTKAPGEGTGLGLAIIHGIVTDHDGRITLRSEPGQGTTFTVELPPCAPAPPEPYAAPLPDPQGQGELIILGDDHKYVREIVSTMLHSMGFRVLQAADGGSVLGLFRANRSRARLLLLDEDMPGCSGWGCVDAVRDSGDDVPALVMAATAEPVQRELPTRTAVLRKPFQIHELSAAIAAAMGKNGSRVHTL
jgi:two-component system, cell cycle sensor histidine kinase and response regulator CckA